MLNSLFKELPRSREVKEYACTLSYKCVSHIYSPFGESDGSRGFIVQVQESKFPLDS